MSVLLYYWSDNHDDDDGDNDDDDDDDGYVLYKSTQSRVCSTPNFILQLLQSIASVG